MSEELGFEVQVSEGQDAAIEKVTAALKEEGFGVLTRIDIDTAFREKIGAEFRPYTILGACNPNLAHTALTSVPEIGLMLPCNVTVEQSDSGSTIRIMNPAIMMQTGELGSEEALREVAGDAREKLSRVAAALGG